MTDQHRGSTANHVTPTMRSISAQARHRRARRRGVLISRSLLAADLLGLCFAFAVAELLFGRSEVGGDAFGLKGEVLVFLSALPGWYFLARIHHLYGRDETRTNHSTADDVAGIFHVMITGMWLFVAVAWTTGWAELNLGKLVTFWSLGIVSVVLARLGARARCRRSSSWIQNTLLVGRPDVLALLARKITHHPEYGLAVVGALPEDASPVEVAKRVGDHSVDRVIVAASTTDRRHQDALIRAVRNLDVEVDVVPAAYEVLGTSFGVHTLEGVPLLGLPAATPSLAALFAKRAIDIVGASVGLVLSCPVFALAAWRVTRDSPGPVFFKQTRLGLNMREFEVLKFRTLTVGDHSATHRDHIQASMADHVEGDGQSGLFKLSRDDVVTSSGRWLRRASMDELPQLINVLRGDMSLVGPRPCIGYETDCFDPHHFERFLVRPGITGLWQVTARAHSTYREALEMDVAYARSVTLGLDFWLILRTPLAVLRQWGGTV